MIAKYWLMEKNSPKIISAKFNLLIKRYFNQDQGFTARRAMFRIEDNSDYDGISRFGEWSIEDKAE